MTGFDNRYPHLHRIQHAPLLSTADKKAAQAIAKRLFDNVGLSTCFNARTGDLFCYYRSPHGGPFSIPFYDLAARTCRRYTDEEVGDYIRLARYGQLDPSEKEAIADRNRKAEEHANKAQIEKHTDDRTPDMLARAKYLDQRRRGTKKLMSV